MRLFLFVLVALVALTGRGASQATDDQIADWFAAAQEAKARGDLDSAEREYLRVLRVRPTLVEARSNLGLVYYLGNRCNDAIVQFTQALRLRPQLDIPLLFSGICQHKLHRYDRAVRVLEKAAALPEARVEAVLYLGLAYAGLGDERRANQAFEKFAAARPTEPEALYQLGGSYLRLASEYLTKSGNGSFFSSLARAELGDMQQKPARRLIEHYQAAIAARPSYPGLNWRLARALLGAEQPDRAEEALRKEVALQPEHIPALLLIAELRRRAMHDDQSREFAKRAQDAASRFPRTRVEWSALYRSDPERAIRLVGIALDISDLPADGIPSEAQVDVRRLGALLDNVRARLTGAATEDRTTEIYSRARMVRGEMTMLRNELQMQYDQRPDSAMTAYLLGMIYHRLSIQTYRRMVEAEPAGYRTLLLKAETLESEQLDEEAEAAFRQVLEKAPDAHGVHYKLGGLLLRRRRPGDAAVEFEKQLQFDPAHSAARVGLAEAYIETERIDAAVRMLEQVTVDDPQMSSAPLVLARAYLLQGAAASAVRMFERAVKLRPNDVNAHYQLAQTYQELGRSAEAEREFAIVRRLRGAQAARARNRSSLPAH